MLTAFVRLALAIRLHKRKTRTDHLVLVDSNNNPTLLTTSTVDRHRRRVPGAVEVDLVLCQAQALATCRILLLQDGSRRDKDSHPAALHHGTSSPPALVVPEALAQRTSLAKFRKANQLEVRLL